jgi:hypothetical protein
MHARSVQRCAHWFLMEISVSEEFGTPAHLLRRNEDPITSHLAAEENNSELGEERVYEIIKSFGDDGCISDQVQDAFGINTKKVAYSGITGRYAALERKFFIERTGEMRVGHRFHKLQLVMRALPDSERDRRQQEHAKLSSEQLTSTSWDAIQQWWKAYGELMLAEQAEALLRDRVVEMIFGHATVGRNVFPFADGSKLILYKKRRSTRLLPVAAKRKSNVTP